MIGVLHISTVTAVDESGMPIEAIGKMGFGGEIVRHAANRAPLGFGPLIAIYRKKHDAEWGI